MNILFVQNDLNPSSGGIARVTSLLSNWLRRQGHNVYYLYYLSDNPEIEPQYKHKYELTMDDKQMYNQVAGFVKGIPGGVDFVINQALFFNSFRKAFARLRKECGFKMVACLHCKPSAMIQPSPTGIVGMLKEIARKISGRTVKQVVSAMCKQADKFVLLSESFRDEMHKDFGIKNFDNICANPNPLTFEGFATDDQIAKKQHTVLIVARLHEEAKNLKAAFRIWKQLESEGVIPHDWQLVLAGHGGDEKELLDYAASLELKNFKFIGRSDNPLELYKQASVFMMTSRMEGFSMTLTEAQQNGVVPIAFGSFGAVYDIIEDGKSGFIIPSFDETQYASKLQLLINDYTLRKTMAHNAVESSKKFHIDNIGQKWQKLFDSLKS